MAIVLLGGVVAALVSGLSTVIAASSSNEQQTKVEAILTSAADRLQAADYIPCPGDSFGDYAHLVAAAADTVGDGSAGSPWNSDLVSIERIQYWDASAGATRDADGDPISADGAWAATNSLNGTNECNPDINLTTSRTLQLVTIRVASPDGDIVRTLDVVKSPIVADPGAGG